MTVKSNSSCIFFFLLLVSLLLSRVSASDNFVKNVPSTHSILIASRGGGKFIRRTKKEGTISLDSDNSNRESSLSSTDLEREKANEVIFSCSKIMALSAVIDFSVDRSKYAFGIGTSKWIFPLTTLWKLSFAYNMWRVSRLYRSKTETRTELLKAIERLMKTMTGIWRKLAFMAALWIINEVVLACNNSFPNIRPVLTILFSIAGAISMYLSTNETRTLESSTTTFGYTETSAQRIVILGKSTVRAMLIGVSVFFLDSIFIPVVAFSKKSWGDTIWDLTNLPTLLAMTKCLWTLRKSFISFIEDFSSQSSTRNNWTLKPETQIQLAVAQQKFWSQTKSFFVSEMIGKIVTSILIQQSIE